MPVDSDDLVNHDGSGRLVLAARGARYDELVIEFDALLYSRSANIRARKLMEHTASFPSIS
jgi:hypothetical protein